MLSLRRHQRSLRHPAQCGPALASCRACAASQGSAHARHLPFPCPPPLLRLRLQPPGCTGPRGLSNRPISSPQRFLRAPFKSRAQARRLGYRSGSGVRGSSGDSGVALCRGAVRGPRGGGYSLARSGEAEGGLQAEDPRLEAQPGRSGCPGPVPPFGPASGGAGPEASGPRGGGSWAAVVVASAGLAVSP